MFASGSLAWRPAQTSFSGVLGSRSCLSLGFPSGLHPISLQLQGTHTFHYKSWDDRCGIQNLFSPRRSWELGISSCGGVLGWSLWQACVSYSFRCGHFPYCLMCRSWSASFWISFRGNCSCVFVHSVHPIGEGSWEASYVIILLDLLILVAFYNFWCYSYLRAI